MITEIFIPILVVAVMLSVSWLSNKAWDWFLSLEEEPGDG